MQEGLLAITAGRAISILLARHGEPELEWPDLCDSRTYDAWSRAYRTCGLHLHSVPPANLIAQVGSYRSIAWVASPLKRAHHSCRILSGGREPALLQELEEVRLPAARDAPGEKSAAEWVEHAILSYNAGQHQDCESPAALAERALAAALALIEHARKVECAVAVGHGLINRLVANAFLELGLHVRAAQPGEYWRWQLFQSGPAVESLPAQALS